jgi:hypothetical protein
MAVVGESEDHEISVKRNNLIRGVSSVGVPRRVSQPRRVNRVESAFRDSSNEEEAHGAVALHR